MLKSRPLVRLILSLFVIQIITGCILVWNSDRLVTVDYSQWLRQNAQINSILLVQTLAPALATNDRSAVLDTLELLSSSGSLRYAAVFNSQRVLVASLGEPPPLNQDFSRDFYYRAIQGDGVFTIEQPIVTAKNNLGLLQLGFADTDAKALINQLSLESGYVLLTGLLVSIIAVVVISLPLSRSLSRLQTGIHALQKGEWGHRITISGFINPAADLIQAFNGLATRQEADLDSMRGHYQQLLEKSQRLNGLLHGIGAVVWIMDPKEGRFTYVSDEAQCLLDYPVEEWLDIDFFSRRVHPSDLNWARGFLAQAGTTPGSFTLDFRIFNSANECLWVRMISHAQVREQAPVLAGLLLNVTEEKRNEQRIAYLANHDPLTGLINRRRFQERLEEQIIYNGRYNMSAALLFIDLDQFKYINDSLGHRAGDEYLRQVSHHLRRSLRKSDIIGRLGGDEFGIILPNTDAEQSRKVCELLLKNLKSEEFNHAGRRAPFGSSIGIALFPQHGNKASDLLTKADSAMYTAKSQGRNTYRMFEDSTVDVARMQEKVQWEERIHSAIKHNRFTLYFQPIVDIHSGIISHYESLLRMIGENGEIIAPGAFIGIAERFGMIRDIDRWVVAHALSAQGASAKVGKSVSLTINLSGRHFGSPEILEVIQDATERYKANPNNIVFEVTETAAVENFTEACKFIQSLHDLGYRFALDDFGAGFSSFDYLKNIPVDYIKIDGSFIRNLNRDKVDQIFVSAIAEMARGLGVKAIAEFVENQEIVDTLRQLGIPLGQGYFFAKPKPRFHEHGRIIIAQTVDS